MAVRVLLVEDNEVYRSTLELLLDGRDGLEIVGSVADGRDAADAAERLAPDVVLMDFRLPGLDGAEATAAIRARTPHAAILCLTAEATDADRAAVLAAGAAGLIEKSSSIDEVVRAIHSANRTRRFESVNLTAQNTAIVLDSTSDFPDAAERFPNMRVVPLYVNFGSESFRDHVDIGSHDFYERLKEAPALPTTSQPTPQDFLDVYEQLAGYERIYALQLSAKLSGTYQSAVTAAGRGRGRPDPGRRHRDRLARRRAARARDPAPARAGHDRRGDRGADRALQGGERRRLHGRHARVPPEGRPHRPRPGARRHAAQRQADPVGRRRRRPPDRQGARPPEGARGVRARLHVVDREPPRAARRDRPRRRAGVDRGAHRPRREGAAGRPRSSSSRTSAPSSAPTPARAPSASSGCRTTRSAS